MNKFWMANRRNLLIVGMVFCMMLMASVSAFAGSKSAVSRTSYQGETHKGLCCSNWDASVTVVEPDRVVPIIVTFSTDYRASATSFVAMRVNGGPCAFYGPFYLPAYSPADESYSSKTFQWVIMPGDYKLAPGPNVITLCGGGTNSSEDTITLGFNTLTAHLAK